MGRTIIVGFGAILGIVPGLVAARVASEYLPARLIPLVSSALIGIDVLAVLYICVRFWLVFPAIAVGDSAIGFARSFSLMKGNVFQIVLGTAIASISLVIAIILVGILTITVPPTVPLFLVTQFLSGLIVLVGTAANAGVVAQAYKVLVLEAHAK